MTATPPTIADFHPGTLHQTGRVARLFDVTPATVLRWIKQGKLRSVHPFGSPHHLIPGEEVRRVWTENGLCLLPVPVPPSQAEIRRQAEAAAKRLDRLHRKSKGSK